MVTVPRNGYLMCTRIKHIVISTAYVKMVHKIIVPISHSYS